MVRQRLLSQQLLHPVHDTPTQVVAHMGAMQAQEYRMMRWAVAMRTRHPSAQSFASEYNSWRIVRLHLMRGTWQLVAGDDYWWMLDLFAERAKRVINGWMKSSHITIEPQEYDRIRTILVDAAQGRRDVTKDDFAQALALQGISMDSHRLSYHIRMAELDGVLCSGDLQAMKMTYCLSADKMGSPTSYDREESIHTIARRYFQSHSPASLDDFVWWTGLSKSDCQKGVGSLGTALHRSDVDGCAFYTLEGCRTEGVLRNNTILLPPYDEYLIGYKSRHMVLAAKHTRFAHTGNGIFFPVILRNGRVAGNWKPFEKEFSAQMFDGELPEASLARQWAKYQKFLTD